MFVGYEFNKVQNRTLLSGVLPGTGKSLFCMQMARHNNIKTLVVACTNELCGKIM